MAPRKPVSKGVNQAAAKAIALRKKAPARGVNQAARKATTPKAITKGSTWKAGARKLATAPGAPPAATKPGAATTTPPAVPVPPGGAVAPGTTTGPGAPPNAGDVNAFANSAYSHMTWALNDASLGPVLRQAATEGWDENRLRGAIFATDWFKTHGTAKVAAQIKEQSDSYLVPMDDQTRRNWSMKILTGEVQPAEMNTYLRETAKSMFPQLAGAIDRGLTVRDYAAPYRSIAANTLEVAPESINLADTKWRRALDGMADDKGQRTAMSLFEWEKMLKTDTTYGYDRTKGARTEAAQFASKLQETFGAR